MKSVLLLMSNRERYKINVSSWFMWFSNSNEKYELENFTTAC